jgi:hypothetical protein
LIIAIFFGHVWRAWPRITCEGRTGHAQQATVLGLVASIAGILVGGILDHYFFNLDFPSSVSIFWLYLGLAMAAVRIADSRLAIHG